MFPSKQGASRVQAVRPSRRDLSLELVPRAQSQLQLETPISASTSFLNLTSHLSISPTSSSLLFQRFEVWFLVKKQNVRKAELVAVVENCRTWNLEPGNWNCSEGLRFERQRRQENIGKMTTRYRVECESSFPHLVFLQGGVEFQACRALGSCGVWIWLE